jgi:hypothetical protein
LKSIFEAYIDITAKTTTTSMRMSPTEAIRTPLAAQAASAASSAAAAAQPDMASREAALQLQALADARPAQSQAAPATPAQEDAMQGVIAAEPERPPQHGVQGLDAAEPEELEVQHLDAAGLEPPQPTDETLRISAPAALQEPAPAAVSPASAEEILDLSEVSVEEYGELYHGEALEDDAMWISIEQERANAVAVVEDEQAQGEAEEVEMEDAQTEGEGQQVGEEDAQTQGEKRQSEDELHSEDDVISEASHQQGRQTKRVKLEGSTDGSEAPRSRQRLLRQLAE